MRGLVLSGGGRKGAFQVGVLEVLAKSGLDWDFMAGTSVGAINVGYLAGFPIGQSERAVAGLVELWNGIDTRNIWKHWAMFGPMAGAWKSSFFNSSPLHSLLRGNIDEARIRASGRKVRYGIVNYGTGAYFEATERSTPQWKYVAASSSYPGGLNPVALPEGFCGDGGAVSATPLKSAVDAGCTALDIVVTDPLKPNHMDTHDNWLGTRVSAVTIALRSVGLLMHTAMMRDVARLMQVNDSVANGVDRKHRMVEVNVYAPSRSLTSGPVAALEFDPKVTREMIDYGRQVASGE
jgi:predicted acylesterase/phospholipase RssA